MSVKLYVGNLSYSTTKQDLNDLFSAVGTVESCTIIEDRTTRMSRGFGFVEMSSKAESENAVAQLDGREVSGRPIKVSHAKAKHEAPSRVENYGRYNEPVLQSFPARAYFKQPVDIFGW